MSAAVAWWRRLLRLGLLHGLVAAAFLTVGGLAGVPSLLAVAGAAAGVGLLFCVAALVASISSREGS